MIRIVEVGPRDGLQNESVPVPIEQKARFIHALRSAGLQEIEVTSFVRPEWVPQLADADSLLALLGPDPLYSALVPNPKGLQRALDSGVKRIALFTAASEEFTKKNINRTIEESLRDFEQVVEGFRAVHPDGFVRGYVSTAFECPYAGAISPEKVTEVSLKLIELGVDEIALGDTIGVASPREVHALNEVLLDSVPREKVAYHFHDTRGTAIANVAAALDWGITSFDSAAAGLGGCPYAKGAGGNLATEDLVYFLQREGLEVNIDLKKLAEASLEVLETLGRPVFAKAQLAVLAE